METSTPSRDGSRSRPWTDPRSVLRTLLAVPDEQPDLADADLRRSLVAGLADENPTVRFASSWAIRLLAADQPNALPGLVGYLAANRDASDDVRSVLSHLTDRYPDLVRPALDHRDIAPQTLTPTDGGPVAPSLDDTAPSLTTTLEEIQSVIATADEVPTVFERVMNDTENGGEHRHSANTEPIPLGDGTAPESTGGDTNSDTDHDSETETDGSDPDGESKHSDASTGRERERTRTGTTGRSRPRTVTQQKRADIDAIEASELFQAIRARSEFDDLQVVLPRDGRRYADTIRARALSGSDERGTALRLLDQPAQTTDDPPAGYEEAIAEPLARWQGAGRTAGVVTVHDWACEPRPWLATDPVEETIADWTPPSLGARLRCGLRLAESVAACHRQGVVHAGLDPGNVVLSGDSLTMERRPMLDNVGLLFAIREYFELGEYLDLRYVAPEYLDDSYGPVDHSTDIYQLGTVLYRLFTDRAPFSGDESAVREAVVSEEPPAPSERNTDLPEAIDDVIWKAIAKRKLVRYETATQLQLDLKQACLQAGFEVEVGT